MISSENLGTPASTPSSTSSSSGTSSIIFTSPFEDTSGLDVFAQIAASAHPLPVEPTTVRRSSAAQTSSIVQQSQSQLAQSIYQSQQALKLQQQQQLLQKRDSFDSTVSKFDPKISEYDDEEDVDFDSDDFDSESETSRTIPGSAKSSHSHLMTTPIREETESDLVAMEVDHSMSFNQQIQRRRSPSLSASMEQPQMLARRLSAPDTNNLNLSAGFSTRRVIHNICERKRRENIRDGFSQLQNRLPAHIANNPKLSKMEVLAGAKNFINDIRGRIANLSAEISALSQVSEQLEKNKETLKTN